MDYKLRLKISKQHYIDLSIALATVTKKKKEAIS
jgi:hypothetical protein